MILVIRNLSNETDRKEIKVTGVEISTIDNRLLYVEEGKPDQVQFFKMQTTHEYFIRK